MVICSWNLGARAIEPLLIDLVEAEGIDVLALSECKLDLTGLSIGLSKRTNRQFSTLLDLNPRIKLVTALPRQWTKPIEDNPYWSIVELREPLFGAFLLVAVHLVSKLWLDEPAQSQLVPRLRAAIEAAEHKAGHPRTIVIGDLNMDPFEVGLVSSEGLHGVMDRRIAEKVGRTVQGEFRKYFYNPMWSRLGDASSGPPGTYYRTPSGPVARFWHTIDQVLLRPAFLPAWKDEQMRVVTKIGSSSLAQTDGTPDSSVGSDHFPLVVKIGES